MRPFFLWIHFFGPYPVRKPDEELAERMRGARFRYDLRVEGVDRQIGRILDALERHGFFGRGVVILHGDHGESLGEHGYLGHGANLYDPSLRVPLIVTAPGLLPRGARARSLARNVDIAPTVLDLAGIAPPDDVDGRSLVAMMNTRDDAAVEDTYCETLLSASVFHAPLVSLPGGESVRAGVVHRCLRSAAWKYVDTQSHPLIDFDQPQPVPARLEAAVRSEQLYDLTADPGENKNLVAARPEVRRRMRERMLALIGEEVQRREAGGRRGD
jgi:arylsulfatase A-like enzyme